MKVIVVMQESVPVSVSTLPENAIYKPYVIEDMAKKLVDARKDELREAWLKLNPRHRKEVVSDEDCHIPSVEYVLLDARPYFDPTMKCEKARE